VFRQIRVPRVPSLGEGWLRPDGLRVCLATHLSQDLRPGLSCAAPPKLYPLYQLKLAARQGLESIANYAAAMASFLFYLPTVLLWLATILIGAATGWRLLRWAGKALFVPRTKTA